MRWALDYPLRHYFYDADADLQGLTWNHSNGLRMRKVYIGDHLCSLYLARQLPLNFTKSTKRKINPQHACMRVTVADLRMCLSILVLSITLLFKVSKIRYQWPPILIKFICLWLTVFLCYVDSLCFVKHLSSDNDS